MIVLRRLALALLPAVLFGVYSARPSMAWISFVVLVPWVVLYTDPRYPKVSWVYYSLGAWVSWMTLHAATFRFGWFVPPAMGLILGFFWHPFALALRRVHARLGLPRSVSVAILWVAVEWLRGTFTLANFDIYQLGYSLAGWATLVQIADVTGVAGVSLLLAATNGWLADAWFSWRERGGLRQAVAARPVAVGAVALAAAWALVAGYGVVRLAGVGHVDGPRLAILQPNLPHSTANVRGVHLAQSLLTVREVPRGEADLIVWPENAILDDLRAQDYYLEDLARLAADRGAPILVGAQGEVEDDPSRATNSAYLVDRDGTVVQRYDKQVLFPWSEFVPADDLLMRTLPSVGRLHRLIARIGWGSQASGRAGDGTVLFELTWKGGTIPFAALICVENTNPLVPAEAGREGARFFVNITSEGTVGGPTQEQLLRTAILRAVENRMGYVRAGNTGISGMIAPSGRVTSILSDEDGRTINVEGSLLAPVPLPREGVGALYPATRDAFARLIVLAAVGLLLATFRQGPRGAKAATAAVLIVLALGCSDPGDLGDDPSSVDGSLRTGEAALRGGATGVAMERLRAACATEDGCRRALPLLGAAAYRRPDDDASVVLFATIADRYPSLAGEARLYEGVFRERTADVEGAIDAYRLALETDGGERASTRLASLLLRAGRTAEALDLALGAFESGNDPAEHAEIAGRALRESGRAEEAAALLKRAIAAHPREADLRIELGRVLEDLGETERALEAWGTALVLDGDSIGARFFLGRAALARGDLQRAARMTDEILRLDGTRPAPGGRER